MTETSPLVLIADDEASIRLLVRVNLEAEGYRVIEAADGHATLEMARTDRPDVVLLDVMMPGLDGWQVAEAMIVDPELADIPIMFLTARADLRDHERGLSAGALQYITKPFNPRVLAPAIDECLDQSRAGRSEEFRSERLRIVRELQQHPE